MWVPLKQVGLCENLQLENVDLVLGAHSCRHKLSVIKYVEECSRKHTWKVEDEVERHLQA